MAAILDFGSERRFFCCFFLLSWLIYSYPDVSYQVSTGRSVLRTSKNIDFEDSSNGGQLEFPIGTILAIFDPPGTIMLLTKIQVSWWFWSCICCNHFICWSKIISSVNHRQFSVVNNSNLDWKSEDVIYVYTCNEGGWGMQYAEHTKRALKTRFTEHLLKLKKQRILI